MFNDTTTIRALLIALWPTLKWRHHGIGCLQAYVSEHTEPEVRVHVWSERLLKPGMSASSGATHDHRFDLESTVLVGRLFDYSYAGEREVPNGVSGYWSIADVQNARAAGEEQGYDGQCVTLPGQYNLFGGYPRTILPGETYRLERGLFHHTETLSPVAVTLVKMHDKRGQARIAYMGTTLVHAFGKEPIVDAALSAQILDEAFQALKLKAAGT